MTYGNQVSLACSGEGPASAPMTVGPLTLDVDQRLLFGPRGSIHLSDRYFVLAERLMRRPGVVVSLSDLLSTLYPDADGEPENAGKLLQQAVGRLRAVFDALGGSRAYIQVESGIGYAVRLRGR